MLPISIENIMIETKAKIKNLRQITMAKWRQWKFSTGNIISSTQFIFIDGRDERILVFEANLRYQNKF